VSVLGLRKEKGKDFAGEISQFKDFVDHEHIREGEHFMVHVLELRDFYRINPQSYAVTKTTSFFFIFIMCHSIYD
jgi:hypothetical protein